MKKWVLVVFLVAIGACLPAPPVPAETPVALDLDYVYYENAMTVKPSAQWQQATNQLFFDLKAALGANRLYEALDVMYLFTAETEQAALLNAAKRDHDATNHGMAFTRRVGVQGDGAADYIDTNYNPTSDGVTYALDDALIGVYNWSGTASLTDIGETDTFLRCNNSGAPGSGFYYKVNSPTAHNPGGGGAGLCFAERSASTVISVYKNGAIAATTAATSGGALPANNLFVGALDSSGTAVGFSTGQYGAAFIGRSFTADEHAAVYEAWTDYLAAIATEEPPVFNTYFPIVGVNAIIQIFNRAGVPIGEILPEIDFASWRRNDIGQAVFSMAKSDPKADDVYLRAQNRVLITFDNGLPPWGGIMQPEFTIDHNRIQVRALTGESLLTRRLTDRGRYFTQETVGGIVTALINEANAVWPLGITLGTVWAGGDGYSPEYHYKDMLSIFKESLFKRLSDADFYAEPVVGSDGRLTFTLHVAERRGRDLAGVALHQGLNVVDPTKVSFVGPLINSWTIVGDGQGWGSERPVAVAQDLLSIDRYGLLESSEIQQGTVSEETLQANADNLLASTAWPRVLLDITAVDLPPATFEQYGIGDNLAVELPDYGVGSSFVGAATVIARAFYPKNGRLNLVLEATSNA